MGSIKKRNFHFSIMMHIHSLVIATIIAIAMARATVVLGHCASSSVQLAAVLMLFLVLVLVLPFCIRLLASGVAP